MFSVDVLDYRYDPSSSGVNSQETTLTPANVNAGDFGKLSSTPVDGQVYAQPLYVAGVNINGATHNVVYVATEHDSVYAIDANNGQVLWHDSFLGPGITTVPSADTGSPALQPELGITATPVIDPNTNSIYVLANTKETRADGSHYVYKLHALNLATGGENLGGPLTIGDTICNDPTNPADGGDYTYVSGPSVNGSGAGSVNGKITFNALRELGRIALTESDGNIFMAFASHPDIPPAHGWVLAVNARTLSLWGAVNVTPNGEFGDIWEAGDSIPVDQNGDLYVSTGNGTFDGGLNSAGFPAEGDYGDSIIKLAYDPNSSPYHQNINGYGLKVVDFFTPADQQTLADNDLDFGSGGIVLLPTSAGNNSTPHLLVEGTKDGTVYLANTNNLSRYNPSGDQVVQEAAPLSGNVYSTPAYFNGTLYYATVGGNPEAYSLTNGVLSTTPSSTSPDTFGYPGATPTISANGTTNGIMWMIDNGSNELRAYDASNLSNEIYNSGNAAGGRDTLGTAVKFTVPTVADGEVFVGTKNALVIYGLLSGTGGGGGSNPTDTANRNYVAAAYEDALGRSADSASLASWALALDNGLPRTQFALTLTHSAEYFGRIVEADYQKYLGRAADPSGLAHWIGLMQGGLSDELVEAAFVGSDEFYANSGGTNKDWIDAMYQSLLGRAADASGEAEWLTAMAAGESRVAVAFGFAGSAERESQRVETDYSTYLHRPASAAEVSGWVQAFEHGFSNENVIAGFLASDEYFKLHA